jgi:hypothetical protein
MGAKNYIFKNELSFFLVVYALNLILFLSASFAVTKSELVQQLSPSCQNRTDSVQVFFKGLNFPGNMMTSVAKIQFTNYPLSIRIYTDFSENHETLFDLEQLLYQRTDLSMMGNSIYTEHITCRSSQGDASSLTADSIKILTLANQNSTDPTNSNWQSAIACANERILLFGKIALDAAMEPCPDGSW